MNIAVLCTFVSFYKFISTNTCLPAGRLRGSAALSLRRRVSVVPQRTGTPEEFARKLGVSRTSLYELIDELRSHGAPIAYSKSAKTFFYRQPYDIAVTCSLRPLTISEEKESSGGIKIFSRILFFRT